MKDACISRHEREKLAQREEMLATARVLFSKRGYRNVSMQEIAQEAEFAVGTLYKFFKSKEELYKALLQDGAAKFHDVLMKAIDGPEKEIDKLRNYVKVKGQFFRAHASMVRIYFAETQAVKFEIIAGIESDIQNQREDLLQALTAVFQNGINGRRFKKIADPYYLALAIENLTNTVLCLWLDKPEAHPYPEDPDMILNILFKGLIP